MGRNYWDALRWSSRYFLVRRKEKGKEMFYFTLLLQCWPLPASIPQHYTAMLHQHLKHDRHQLRQPAAAWLILAVPALKEAAQHRVVTRQWKVQLKPTSLPQWSIGQTNITIFGSMMLADWTNSNWILEKIPLYLFIFIIFIHRLVL